MKEKTLTIAEIMLIAGTRVVLGVGVGLLLSTRLNKDQSKAAGVALALVGGLTTIPLALGVIGKKSGVTEIRPSRVAATASKQGLILTRHQTSCEWPQEKEPSKNDSPRVIPYV